MDNYTEIKGIIDQYIVLMDQLLVFEKKKLDAVDKQQTELLDTFLKEEHAYLLQLRGLDNKREKLQKQLGFEGMPYREIIQQTEGATRAELESAYQILSAKTNEFKEVINTLKSYIDIRLHTIDALMEKFGAAPQPDTDSGIYGQIAGQTAAPTQHPNKFKPTKA